MRKRGELPDPDGRLATCLYDLVRDLYPETGRAYAVGVTGPPGVGKSSLISALVRHVREQGRSVGVISVDPSSPFSQGALLGDRIRLADHFLDPEVFIRSMGSRGHQGGLVPARPATENHDAGLGLPHDASFCRMLPGVMSTG